MKKLILSLLILSSIFSFSKNVYAWEPPKNVTVIVGNPPGSGNEIAFRKLTSIVNKENPNVNFVIQHMPGVDQVLALNHLMSQPNNGSVLAIPSKLNFVTTDIWQKKSKRFQWDSFSYITSIGDSPLVLIAHKSSKINTPQEFMKKISNTKEKVIVSIGGGTHRTALEYLIYNAKANKDLVTHINYGGPAQVLLSVLQNETEFGIIPISIAQSQVKDGGIKIIGLTGNVKLSQFPNVPLLNEVAPGIDIQAGWLLIAPPNTSVEAISWYNTEFVKAINSSEFKVWLDENIITIDNADLTPKGMKDKIENLRKIFLTLLIATVNESEAEK